MLEMIGALTQITDPENPGRGLHLRAFGMFTFTTAVQTYRERFSKRGLSS